MGLRGLTLPFRAVWIARAGSGPNLPLLGFVTVGALPPAPSEIAPPSTRRSGVHSRSASRPRFGVEGTTLAARSALVASHHLSGFLLRTHAGLLHPATDPGVRRVSGAVRLGSSRSGDLSPSRPSPSPRRSFRTPRRMSSTAAVPRHRGRCLLVVSIVTASRRDDHEDRVCFAVATNLFGAPLSVVRPSRVRRRSK